ncbi:MAG: hypothetical protein WCR62_07995 [Sulfurospirillaceae bacterium]
MDDKNFEKLPMSVKEANEIINKKRKPSRSFIFEEPNPKENRANLALT